MRTKGRARRHLRIRRRVTGRTARPRLVVYRSNRHIYGALVDDSSGRTLVSVGTLTPALRTAKLPGKTEIARAVGKLLAEKAKQLGVTKVVFDRAGYRYHGRVSALAAGAREGGLVF